MEDESLPSLNADNVPSFIIISDLCSMNMMILAVSIDVLIAL